MEQKEFNIFNEIELIHNNLQNKISLTIDYHKRIGFVCLINQLCERIMIYLISAIKGEEENVWFDEEVKFYSVCQTHEIITLFNGVSDKLTISDSEKELICGLNKIRICWAHHGYEMFEKNQTSKEYYNYICKNMNKLSSDVDKIYNIYKILLNILNADLKQKTYRYTSDVWSK